MSEDFLDTLLKMYGGFKTKKLYAWLRSDGTLLHPPGENYDELASLKDAMQDSTPGGYTVRLIELNYKETKIILRAPPHPDNKPIRGGHAVGGWSAENIEDIEKEFRRVMKRNYVNYEKVQFSIDKETAEGPTVYAECDNVRCWVTLLNEPNTDIEIGVKLKWRSNVTMITRWNRDYHDVHLGDFQSGTDAVETAFLKFLSFQMQEQYLDKYF